MNTKILNLAVLSLLVLPLSVRAANHCTFEVDPNSIQIDWTGYKTTQQVAVNGGFTEVTLVGDLKGSSFESLLGQLEGEVDVKDAAHIRTGNPARDATLFEKFFSLFKKKAHMTGAFKSVKGNEKSGDLQLHLTLNQKTLAVPMSYTRDEKGSFLAKGAIDFKDFGLQKALDSLHKACESLHKGPDGVSKTWPVAEIKLAATITKKCEP